LIGRLHKREESPSIIEQNGREILLKATSRKVQQKITAVFTVRVKRCV